jgi:hypothetical protein
MQAAAITPRAISGGLEPAFGVEQRYALPGSDRQRPRVPELLLRRRSSSSSGRRLQNDPDLVALQAEVGGGVLLKEGARANVAADHREGAVARLRHDGALGCATRGGGSGQPCPE